MAHTEYNSCRIHVQARQVGELGKIYFRDCSFFEVDRYSRCISFFKESGICPVTYWSINLDGLSYEYLIWCLESDPGENCDSSLGAKDY